MLFLAFLILAWSAVDGAYKESYYNQKWCRAQPDFVTVEKVIQGGRVDCVLSRYAVETERAYKWKEGIAQARWYAYKLRKIPAILLIVQDESDLKYERYIEEYAHKHGFFIRVFIIWE